jgi:hypothetical protein
MILISLFIESSDVVTRATLHAFGAKPHRFVRACRCENNAAGGGVGQAARLCVRSDGPNSSRTRHHSLFRRKLPCSGNKNSLFGHAREFVRKSFILLRDRTAAIAKMAHNL